MKEAELLYKEIREKIKARKIRLKVGGKQNN